MSDTSHAMEHLPYFITPPGETDTMLVAVIVVMVLIALGLGVFYLKLHSLPEQMAHSSNHTQMQVVAILGLIALFTHNNIFWIAALLLAAFKLPDYAGTLGAMSNSLDRIASKLDGKPTIGSTGEGPTDTKAQS